MWTLGKRGKGQLLHMLFLPFLTHFLPCSFLLALLPSTLMDEYEQERQEKEREREQQRREAGRARQELETRRRIEARIQAKKKQEANEEKCKFCASVPYYN